MTKRLTITLVALVLFVLLAVLPASAILANPATGLFNGSVLRPYPMNITPGVATVFIGEDQLNATPIFGYLNAGSERLGYVMAPAKNMKVGWWAPGSFSYPNNPSAVIDMGPRYASFYVSPADFGPYLGTWYCLTPTNIADGAAFVVADPAQVVTAWDVQANQGQGVDMTGRSVVRGTILTIKEDTNLAAFTTANLRGDNITPTWVNGTPVYWRGQVGAVQFEQVPPQTWTTVGGAAVAAPVAAVPGEILLVTNWSGAVRTTWGAVSYGSQFFFNNSPAVYDGESGTMGEHSIISGQNVSLNASGLGPYRNGVGTANTPTAAFMAQTVPSAANGDGFITFRVKDETGQVSNQLWTNNQTLGGVLPRSIGITNQWVSTQPWYLGNFTGNNGLTALGWDTGAIDPGLGIPAYPAGTYTVWSETTLSRMVQNYRLNGADYTGKTVSAAGTITLVSDTVKIVANKESVVRSKPFSVTITGRPLTTYWVWVKGTSSMTGGWDNQPPMAGLNQVSVYADPITSLTMPLGQYVGENFVGRHIADMVAGLPVQASSDVAADQTMYNRTRYYVLVNTSSAGTRTVEFITTNWTKAQTYTIRVERDSSMPNQGGVGDTATHVNNNLALRDYKSDEVDVKVEKGAVTITAAGDQSYYLGEEIKFSGTNTETQTTFLFICGPNLNTQGSTFVQSHGIPINQDPRRTRIDGVATDVEDMVAVDYMQRPVNADNTWDWKWGTANWALDAGTYTVYAVSGPRNADHLERVAYGTVSIIIKKPFISATASQSTVAQGDKLFITGTAEGKPQQGIAIWILGKNYAQRVTESVNSDASFSYEVTAATTTGMDAGQYFVVAQHPMQNQAFDIDMCPIVPPAVRATQVCNLQQGTVAGVTQQIFTLLGAGSLQGTDAAEALVQGINSPNVDDTYTKLVFLVEVPVIRIDPIGDRHVGDKFTITATTNLAVDDDVLFEVYSSSFKPTQKTQSGEFSGATGTVKATKGDTGLNKLSFDVDASTFKPDEYIVTANRVLRPASTATALFNVLEGTVQTAAPTAVGTTAAPTQVATTAAPTTVPATPTKTPTQPGFGALVALIGLGAVAFLVVRKH
jgi:PGF-CTERM protein